jgi:phosphohistidine phosphatase
MTMSGPGVTKDSERPLSDEGRVRISRAAAGMRRCGVRVDRILTSPYLRARQTAGIVAQAIGAHDRVEILPEMASGARWEELRVALGAHAAAASVMLVGHQPDLSQISAAILGGGAGLSFRTGTLACMEVDAIPPSGPATLLWLRRAEEMEALEG